MATVFRRQMAVLIAARPGSACTRSRGSARAVGARCQPRGCSRCRRTARSQRRRNERSRRSGGSGTPPSLRGVTLGRCRERRRLRRRCVRQGARTARSCPQHQATQRRGDQQPAGRDSLEEVHGGRAGQVPKGTEARISSRARVRRRPRLLPAVPAWRGRRGSWRRSGARLPSAVRHGMTSAGRCGKSPEDASAYERVAQGRLPCRATCTDATMARFQVMGL